MSNLVDTIVKGILDWGYQNGQGEGPSEEILRRIVQDAITQQTQAAVALVSELSEDVRADIAWYLQKQDEAKAAGLDIWAYLRSTEYTPQPDVAGMMHLFGQEVRPLPTMIENPKERLLTANLVFEEALEFVAAMGFCIAGGGPHELIPSGDEPNLKDAVDAIGDILVVTYGAANRLGTSAQETFKEVNRSNNTKVWPDGTIHRRESDGKVMKPDTYSPADIESVLCKAQPLPYATPAK